MALYSVKTEKHPEKVVKLAIDYFGDEGLGLSLSREARCCVVFEGGGGHVSVTASREEGRTEVELETREWDHHVEMFMKWL